MIMFVEDHDDDDYDSEDDENISNMICCFFEKILNLN